MIAFCALLPLASIFVSLSFGGAMTPFALLESIAILPLFKTVKRTVVRALTPLLLISVVLRFWSLVYVSKDALTTSGAITFAMICFAVSCVMAAMKSAAFRFATPLLFVTLIFAVFVTAISFSTALRGPFDDLLAVEALSALVCPVSSCIAFSHFGRLDSVKRFYASTAGTVLCAVFILFDAKDGEFAFLSVPLVILVSSVEIKAVIRGIKDRTRE